MLLPILASYLPKSDGKGRDLIGAIDGDDANLGRPSRNTTPSDCLAYRCGKGVDALVPIAVAVDIRYQCQALVLP